MGEAAVLGSTLGKAKRAVGSGGSRLPGRLGGGSQRALWGHQHWGLPVPAPTPIPRSCHPSCSLQGGAGVPGEPPGQR